MNPDSRLAELESLRARVAELEKEVAGITGRKGWVPPPYYAAWELLGAMVLGLVGAAASLLFNVVGASLVGKHPLELIRVYLTFPMGESALQMEHGFALAAGVCLYLGTGMIGGIPIHMILGRFFKQSPFRVRFIVATVLGLGVWLVNFYGILSWVQPWLIGGNWIVEKVPIPVAAATHLVFAWTMLLIHRWGEFVPHPRPAAPAASLALILMFGGGALGGCRDTQLHESETDTSKKADFGYQTSVQTALLLEGRKAYEQYCIGCHGPSGAGDGPAARFLNPKPRSFVKANYKFSSTRFGQLPTDEDLYRSITQGLRGSSMPAWNFLPERTRWALVAHIKTLSPKWTERRESPRIPVFADPYRSEPDRSAAIARGEMVYHGFFRCWSCHPAYVDEARLSEYITSLGGTASQGYRPNLGHADIKVNDEGETIFAPDFLRDTVRSGTSIPDLYRTISAGITGTAMPTWVDVFETLLPGPDGKPAVVPGDLWAMAYYVQDLVKRKPPLIAADQADVRGNRELRFGPGGAQYVAKVPGLSAEPESEEEFIEE